MSQEEYDYSLAADFPNGLSLELLQRQLTDAALGPALDYIKGVGDLVAIYYAAPLVNRAALDAVVAEHDPAGYTFAANYQEDEYIAGRQVRETWYAFKNPAGAYLYKFSERTYVFDGAYLVSEQLNYFNSLGAVISTRNWIYTTTVENSSTLVRKEEVL